MSKRSGDFVPLDEVLDEIGVDATRFTLITRSTDARMEFDLELAKKQSDENPVYYVQMGHARVCSLFRKAAERAVGGAPNEAEVESRCAEAALSRLTEEAEIGMIRRLTEFPEMVADAANRREPHRVVFYLQDLVRAFHAYYAKHRVLHEDDVELSFDRLALCSGIRTVLANGLALCGVSAPRRMDRETT